MSLRIVTVSYTYVPGQDDPHRWLEKLSFFTVILKALAATSTVTNISFINWQGDFQKDGVRYSFPGYRPVSINLLIRKLRPDVVIVQGFQASLQVTWLRLLLGKDVQLFLQHRAEVPGHTRKDIFRRVTDRFVDGYFFISEEAAIPWVAKRIIDKQKIHIIPGASSAFDGGKTPDSPQRANNFLWVGRLDANKDPLTAINAFSNYCTVNQDARLFMIYQDNQLLGDVELYIREKQLTGKIVLVGSVARSGMLSWFNRCGFIISSSLYEGGNISVIEAMSCGCIPIVTNIPSFRTHTDDGRIGFRFNPGNVAELTEILIATQNLDINAEYERVLNYYDRELSPGAISEKILRLIRK